MCQKRHTISAGPGNLTQVVEIDTQLAQPSQDSFESFNSWHLTMRPREIEIEKEEKERELRKKDEPSCWYSCGCRDPCKMQFSEEPGPI